MTFGIQHDIVITICDDAADATARGFKYTRPTTLPIEIERAVVVKDGTKAGNPTVDLILRDENGQQYVVMITGKLLKTLTNIL